MGKISALLKRASSAQGADGSEPLPFEPESTVAGHSGADRSISSNGSATRGIVGGSPNGFSSLTREQLKLRSTLLYANEKQGVRSVLVTGINEGAGVSSIAVALAQGLSWDQQKDVMLVDANFNRPQLHRIFQLRSRKGLTDAFAEGANLLDVTVSVEPPNLMILPFGEVSGRRALDTKRLANAIPLLQENCDFLIIDAPPISLHPDVLMLGSYLDSVALVVEAERTRVQELEAVIEELRRSQARLLGVILNREKTHLPSAINNLI